MVMNAESPGHVALVWEFEGSIDGKVWDVLDSQNLIDTDFDVLDPYQEREFTI